jgi:hypothetical protein
LTFPSIKALAKSAASVNHHVARPPRLTLIDAPFSSRLSRYIKTELDESERLQIQTLLREEELSLKRHTLKAN